MENRILTAESWQQRIRDKMGVDDTYLPDSVIVQSDIITVAESNVIAQISNYTTLIDDSKVYLESAVVLECCILLCSGMATRLPKKESGPHASHELGIDWNKIKKEFIEEKDSYIMKVLNLTFPEGLSSTLQHFSVTYPKREW